MFFGKLLYNLEKFLDVLLVPYNIADYQTSMLIIKSRCNLNQQFTLF